MFKTEFVSGNDDFKTDFTPGNNGMSAYELWLEQGNKGTEQDFLDSLRGDKGDPGVDGYTPVKGVDYFDGENGKDGYTPVKGVDYFDGKDGYTPIKGIDYFDGQKGDTGENGYTPVKGTDYFTQNDVAEMVAAVKNQLVVEQWTFTLLDDTVVTKDVVME